MESFNKETELPFEREPDPNRRAVMFLDWLSEEARSAGVPPPILVGGAAVAFYTGGCYTSGDIDMVSSHIDPIFDILRRYGFERDGRYWIKGLVVAEFPSSELAGRYDVFELPEGRSIRIISIEDLIADRLAAAKFWRSKKDRQWAGVLLRSATPDVQTLMVRTNIDDTTDLLKELLDENEMEVEDYGYTQER